MKKSFSIDNLYIELKKIYKDNLLKNSIYIMATTFSSMILGFLFWMLATRLYTPGDVGIISAILSSMSLIVIASCVGLPMALTLYLPVNIKNANRIINSAIIVGIIMSVTLSLIFISGLDIWSPKLKPILGNYGAMAIFVVTTSMATISMYMGGMFTAGKKSSFHMIKENIFCSTKMLLLIIFSSFGAIGIFLSWSVGLLITVTVGFFLLFKLWGYRPMFVFDPIIKNMARFSIGNYIAGIFYNIPKFIFPILIINTISAESAGYFFIAMTIAGVFYGIPEAMAGPFLAESYDKDNFWKNVVKTIKFDMYLLIPGLILLIIFGKFILNVFNPSYADQSFNSLVILSIASIPLSLITTFNMIRNSQKNVSTSIKIDAIVTITTLALSMPLMRIWNIEGIAISYLVANTLVAIVIMLKIKNPIGLALGLLRGDKIVYDHFFESKM